METDYDSYAVLYSCKDIFLGYKKEQASVFSREPLDKDSAADSEKFEALKAKAQKLYDEATGGEWDIDTQMFPILQG